MLSRLIISSYGVIIEVALWILFLFVVVLAPMGAYLEGSRAIFGNILDLPLMMGLALLLYLVVLALLIAPFLIVKEMHRTLLRIEKQGQARPSAPGFAPRQQVPMAPRQMERN